MELRFVGGKLQQKWMINTFHNGYLDTSLSEWRDVPGDSDSEADNEQN